LHTFSVVTTQVGRSAVRSLLFTTLLAGLLAGLATVLAPGVGSAATDSVEPDTAIAAPTWGAELSAGTPVDISGWAGDDRSVARARITIYSRDGWRTWDGETFTVPYTTVDAALSTSGNDRSREWTYRFSAPIGSYLVVARAFDAAGNFDTSPRWTSFSVVAADLPKRLNPVEDLRVVDTSANSITVAWNADDDPRRRSFDFFVDGRWVTYVPEPGASGHTFGDLDPTTEYRLGVTAVGNPDDDWPAQHYSPRVTIEATTESPGGGSGGGGTGGGGSPGTVVWEDNFDVLDTTRWSLEHSTYGDGNNELQCYTPSNVSVRDGKLVLRAIHETYTCPNGSTRRVTSGMVRSRNVTFSPGQSIEFRVKLTPADPNDQGGLWPAVWSSGWAGSWPRGGELDFFEAMTAIDPSRSIYSAHYQDTSGRHGVRNRPVYEDGYFSDSWHVVRFDYGTGGNLRWYLDGDLVHTITDLPTAQGYPAPFDQTIDEIKINLALGGRPGPLAWGALGRSGATFEVDYIRILEP
jgi:hypothetical protein